MTDIDARIKTDGYDVVPTDTLTEFPGNPRRGDVEAIRESIRANGFVGALVVQLGTRHVLSGNHTLQALRAEGINDVPVTWANVDDAGAKRLVLAFNRAADLGYYDNDALANLLADLGDAADALEGTLYGSSDLDALMRTIRTPEAGDPTEPDDVGETFDARTPADRADDHAASPIRSIILPLAVSDYEETVGRLVALRQRWDLETNAEVVLEALRRADDDG